ncbi:MAG: hypothetical protein RL095_1240 [Verrucomicrobiota bacterium]|jgi:hypothetical protein
MNPEVAVSQHPLPEELFDPEPNPILLDHLSLCPVCAGIRRDFGTLAAWQAAQTESSIPAQTDAAIRAEFALQSLSRRRRKTRRRAAYALAASAAAALFVFAILPRGMPDSDINSDGLVDVLDSQRLALALNRGGEARDLNRDGLANAQDLKHLRRTIVSLGPEETR